MIGSKNYIIASKPIFLYVRIPDLNRPDPYLMYPPKRLNCHFKKELVGKFRKIMINQSMDFLQSMILRQTTWIHLAP